VTVSGDFLQANRKKSSRSEVQSWREGEVHCEDAKDTKKKCGVRNSEFGMVARVVIQFAACMARAKSGGETRKAKYPMSKERQKTKVKMAGVFRILNFGFL
jgi:hypothetical protein